jgi:hypothetical protein
VVIAEDGVFLTADQGRRQDGAADQHRQRPDVKGQMKYSRVTSR